MRSIVVNLVALLALIGSTMVSASSSLCIALTNLSDVAIEFSGVLDPGHTYIVKPQEMVTLSGDHMVGACLLRNSNDCAVSISSVDNSDHSEIITRIPRGAHIFYTKFSQYLVDVNAKVKCR